MVKFLQPDLSRTFAALADPNRRAILARLERQPGVSVSALADPLTIKLPAVMKHLDVLEGAGLITRTKTGRTVSVALCPGPMEEAMAWLKRYERFWSAQLDRLAAFVEEDACPPNPASPSNAGSTHRPQRSTPPGRTRKS